MPVAHDLGDIGFELGDVPGRALTRIRTHDHVHAGQRRLVEEYGRVDAFGAEIVPEHGLDTLAHFGIEAVARHIGEHREKPAVAVPSHEQARACALAQVEHGHGDLVEFVGRALEDFVARKGIEDVPQRLARMRVALEPRAGQDGVVVLAQQRHLARRRHVRRRGQQSEETLFEDRLAARVEAEHREVVHVTGPVHARTRVGLGQDQGADRAGLLEIAGCQGFQ